MCPEDPQAAFAGERDRARRDALKDASVERLEAALDGTIGDAQAFCWGALRQFDRHAEPTSFTSPRDFGLQHAERLTGEHTPHVIAIYERFGMPAINGA